MIMTQFFDTYVSAPDKDTLLTFARSFVNYIQPQQGRAAVPESTDADGNVTPAMPAAGDPALWYTCIRATFPIAAVVIAPLAVVEGDTGAAVVGVWA